MANRIDETGDRLARARAGEEAGFLLIWRELQPRLLRYLRVLGCDDPDDVASETWLQVIRDMHRFDGGEEDFRRWLFTVGRHRAIDAARTRGRRRTVSLPATFDSLPDEHLVEDQVLELVSTRKAVQLLTKLRPDQAEVIALRVLAGLDTTAVAGILGKSPGAVRVALHRGLRALARDPAVQALAPGLASRHEVGDPALCGAEEVDA